MITPSYPCPWQKIRTFWNHWQILHICQADFMIKTFGNFVMFIWSKFSVISNLAEQNLALRQTASLMKRTNRRPKIKTMDRLSGFFFPGIGDLGENSLSLLKPKPLSLQLCPKLWPKHITFSYSKWAWVISYNYLVLEKSFYLRLLYLFSSLIIIFCNEIVNGFESRLALPVRTAV